jgi:hypothetical protein
MSVCSDMSSVQAEWPSQEILRYVLHRGGRQTEVPTTTRVRLMSGLATPASPDLWTP